MKRTNNWNWLYKFGGAIASLALMVTMTSANSACIFVIHQPELPESAKRFRKF